MDSTYSTDTIKLLDGGFSTQLVYHVGAKIDGDPLWTSRFLSTNPDAVFKTHLDYLHAGSDIIETDTYQASIPGFKQYLNVSDAEAIQLIKSAVDLAKKAVQQYKKDTLDKEVTNSKPLIAGSIGSYGASLHDYSEYNGEKYSKKVSSDFLKDWHRPRMQALLEAGVDLLAIETIPCAKEAEALVDLLKEFPNAKAWLSFSCRNENKIADGNEFKENAIHCYKKSSGQLIAVGVNCLIPRLVTPLLKSISKQEINEFIPMVVYPNSGEKYSTSGEKWVVDNDFHPPEEFVKDWLDLGVRYIGGCCRTDAKEIIRIGTEVRSWKKERDNSNIKINL